MVTVLYSIERAFMTKTFEAIDAHLDVPSAGLPVNEDARDVETTLDVVDVENADAFDENVRRIDPAVVVLNHRYPFERFTFHEEYPTVHIRHGASIGRGEIDKTNAEVLPHTDRALAPGERWARRYREGVDVSVVGIPEADEFVHAEAPRERRVLYAPTNHNYGGGSFCNTAEHVLDVFADSDYELLFRPHPMDRIEEPAKSVAERCQERIADLDNVVYDVTSTPRESVLAADLLVSDYSGLVTEWLHTDRPLVQLTDVAADRDVPQIGHTTDRLDLATVDRLYEAGARGDAGHQSAFVERLGVPMDGRAGERAAADLMEVAGCTA